MALRDQMEDLAAAWYGWPAWRRRAFGVAALLGLAFAAWLVAGVVVARLGPDVAATAHAAVAADGPRTDVAAGAEATPDPALARALEEELAGKAASLLERVVGEGRVAVQVHADLDWSRREATRERFDPEGQVERREERTTEPPGARAAARATERVEYDVSKEVTREVTPGGALRRLHVAVLLDRGPLEADGASAEVVAQLETLAKQAVGFSSARGDVFSLASLPFQQSFPGSELLPRSAGEGLALAALLGLLLLGAGALLRRGGEAAGAAPLPMTTAALEAALLQGAAISLPVDAGAPVASDDVASGPARDAGAAALRAWLEER